MDVALARHARVTMAGAESFAIGNCATHVAMSMVNARTAPVFA